MLFHTMPRRADCCGNGGGVKIDRKNLFYTLKGYQLSEDSALTPAMEDYLEMLCRLLESEGGIRLSALAERLNVRRSSASKMVGQLRELGYLSAERYGEIFLTEKGKAAGGYLLRRHEIIHNFLCLLNSSESELEETEKIEHFLSRRTVLNLEKLAENLHTPL